MRQAAHRTWAKRLPGHAAVEDGRLFVRAERVFNPRHAHLCRVQGVRFLDDRLDRAQPFAARLYSVVPAHDARAQHGVLCRVEVVDGTKAAAGVNVRVGLAAKLRLWGRWLAWVSVDGLAGAAERDRYEQESECQKG